MGKWIDDHFGLVAVIALVLVTSIVVGAVSWATDLHQQDIARCTTKGMIYAHVDDQRVPIAEGGFNHYGKGDYCIKVQPGDMQ